MVITAMAISSVFFFQGALSVLSYFPQKEEEVMALGLILLVGYKSVQKLHKYSCHLILEFNFKMWIIPKPDWYIFVTVQITYKALQIDQCRKQQM